MEKGTKVRITEGKYDGQYGIIISRDEETGTYGEDKYILLVTDIFFENQEYLEISVPGWSLVKVENTNVIATKAEKFIRYYIERRDSLLEARKHPYHYFTDDQGIEAADNRELELITDFINTLEEFRR